MPAIPDGVEAIQGSKRCGARAIPWLRNTRVFTQNRGLRRDNVAPRTRAALRSRRLGRPPTCSTRAPTCSAHVPPAGAGRFDCRRRE